MRTISLTIDAEYDGAKIRDVLSKRLLISDGLCSKLKRRKNSILLNGSSAYVTARTRAGDLVSVSVGDPEKDPHIRPVYLPLNILYEDPDLVVINKPSNLPVHPVRDPEEITVENALAFYISQDENPHPVSRLDKDTTGIMTIAKSGWAHSFMKALQSNHQMHKTYLALVKGCPSSESGMIDAPIGLSVGSSYKRAIRTDGSASLSEYRIIASWDDVSLILLVPHSGRTHQLRVHMAYIGCPLLGDWLYGERDARISRPALHSYQLSFDHPLTHQRIALCAPLPEDMSCLIPPSVRY